MKNILNLFLGLFLLLFISCGDDEKTLITPPPSPEQMAIEDAIHHLEDGPFLNITPVATKDAAVTAVDAVVPDADDTTRADSQLIDHHAFTNISASATTNFVWLSVKEKTDVIVAIDSSDVNLAFYDADGATDEIEVEKSGEEDESFYSVINITDSLIIGFSADSATTFKMSFAVLGEENHEHDDDHAHE